MKTIKNLEDIGEIVGKKILLRVDFNVPIDEGKVVDDYRIVKSLPTINWLREKGARVILISHLDEKSGVTLAPVGEYLQSHFPVKFVGDVAGEAAASAAASLGNGDVILLENLRQNPGEEANDESFAKSLASFADVYINDAFAVSHRAHASIVGVPKFLPKYAGLLMDAEIKNLSSVFNPPHPFLFILGGAKFDTKLPLIEKFLSLAEHVFVGGALSNNIFKEMGYEVGKSLVSDGDFNIKNLLGDQRLIIPKDVEVMAESGEKIIRKSNEVQATEAIYDSGPETLANLANLVKESKCVLWNGPLGNYEKGFIQPTIELANMLAASGDKTIVGGGDTLAAIASSGAEEKISFISTGGGAMLQFLLDETLPGIEALKN